MICLRLLKLGMILMLHATNFCDGKVHEFNNTICKMSQMKRKELFKGYSDSKVYLESCGISEGAVLRLGSCTITAQSRLTLGKDSSLTVNGAWMQVKDWMQLAGSKVSILGDSYFGLGPSKKVVIHRKAIMEVTNSSIYFDQQLTVGQESELNLTYIYLFTSTIEVNDKARLRFTTDEGGPSVLAVEVEDGVSIVEDLSCVITVKSKVKLQTLHLTKPTTIKETDIEKHCDWNPMATMEKSEQSATARPSSTETDNSNPPSGDRGNTKTVIGIVIGVLLLVMIMTVPLFYLVIRKCAKKNASGPQISTTTGREKSIAVSIHSTSDFGQPKARHTWRHTGTMEGISDILTDSSCKMVSKPVTKSHLHGTTADCSSQNRNRNNRAADNVKKSGEVMKKSHVWPASYSK